MSRRLARNRKQTTKVKQLLSESVKKHSHLLLLKKPMESLKVKVVTLLFDDSTFVQYVDSDKVTKLLEEVKKIQPGMAHFVNNKCTYHGNISKAKCQRLEQEWQQQIN